MQVREIMSAPAVTVTLETPLEEVAKRMIAERVGCTPVVDDQGRLAGIITESDFAAEDKGIPFCTFRFPAILGEFVAPDTVEQIYRRARTVQAREIMHTPVVTVNEDDSLYTVVQRMLQNGIHRIPVLRGSAPAGVVARHDLLRLMLSNPKALEATPQG